MPADGQGGVDRINVIIRALRTPILGRQLGSVSTMRQAFRFDLKLMLLLMLNCSVLAWIAADVYRTRPLHGWPRDEVERGQERPTYEGTMLLSSILTTTLTLIWISRNRNRPLLMGAIGAIFGLIVLFTVHLLVLGIHYLFYYEGGVEYVEDGALLGLVIEPVIITVLCSPLLAAIGALIGGAFWVGELIVRRLSGAPHQHSQSG